MTYRFLQTVLHAAISAMMGLVAFEPSALALDTTKLQPTGYVNDFAHVIDAGNLQAITEYCGNLERISGVQFAVVTIPSLEDDTVEDVAVRLYKQWGVGKKGKDEGLMVLLSIQDRKQRAEVGYGLEPIITDATAGDVLRSMRPLLRQGAYGDALYSAVRQFGDRVVREKNITDELLKPAEQPQPRGGSGGTNIVPIIMLVIFLIAIFGSRGGRSGGGGGGVGNIVTGMILGNLMNGGRRRGNWGGGGFGGYDGGGSSGGGSWGGGGGFGGFGGGSSGGGGASSDW